MKNTYSRAVSIGGVIIDPGKEIPAEFHNNDAVKSMFGAKQSDKQDEKPAEKPTPPKAPEK